MSHAEPTVRRHLSRWLVEGALIVASVLLGFAVAQYGERRSNDELKARAMASLHAEMEHNLKAIEPYVEFHRDYVEALRTADAMTNRESGFQVYLRVRPPLPASVITDMPMVRTAAWEAATSSGALRLIDYDVVASLAEVYQMQDHLGEAIGRIPISTPDFFDPAMGPASVRLSQAAVSEVLFAERSLVELYKAQLDSLRK